MSRWTLSSKGHKTISKSKLKRKTLNHDSESRGADAPRNRLVCLLGRDRRFDKSPLQVNACGGHKCTKSETTPASRSSPVKIMFTKDQTNPSWRPIQSAPVRQGTGRPARDGKVRICAATTKKMSRRGGSEARTSARGLNPAWQIFNNLIFDHC